MHEYEWHQKEFGGVGILPDGHPRGFMFEEEYREAYDNFTDAFDRGLYEWEESIYA